jgi:hypothetical protein
MAEEKAISENCGTSMKPTAIASRPWPAETFAQSGGPAILVWFIGIPRSDEPGTIQM